ICCFSESFNLSVFYSTTSVSLFIILITAIAGGYVEENVTDAAELSAFGSYWVSMEDELWNYPLDDDYPDNYDVYYYGLDNIGMDMAKLMAYYNAVSGKSVYDDEGMMSIEELFGIIYTWETSEVTYNEGSEDEYHEIYADLIVADIDELIDELTDEQLELYNVCYEVYTEDEEYSEIWDGL
ncbi:MAG: hypothetical protein Q4G33_07870, partial [bacterium]|nr:hypothetical protein [bacterium]